MVLLKIEFDDVEGGDTLLLAITDVFITINRRAHIRSPMYLLNKKRSYYLAG